jgi:CRP-like cAMP-binding protein
MAKEIKKSQAYLECLLGKMNSYAPISKETWEEFKKICRVYDIEKDEEIVTLGEKSESIFFVAKGIFRAFVLGGDEGEKEVVKNFFDEERFPASITSMLKNEVSNFCMQALEPSIVVKINFKGFRELLKKKDDLKWFHIQYLEKHWLLEREPQELSLLNQDASKRYLSFLKQYPGIIDRVALYHVASRIGVTPTQLSRIRKELKS